MTHASEGLAMPASRGYCGVSRVLLSNKLILTLLLLLLGDQVAQVTSTTSFQDVVTDVKLVADGPDSEISWRLENPSGAVQEYFVSWVKSNDLRGRCSVANSGDGVISLTMHNCPRLVLQSSSQYIVYVVPLGKDKGKVGVSGIGSNFFPVTDVIGDLVLDAGTNSIQVNWILSNPIGANMTYEVGWSGPGFHNDDVCDVPATDAYVLSSTTCKRERRSLLPCTLYAVTIHQRNIDSGQHGSVARGMAYTLTEGSIDRIDLTCQGSTVSKSQQQLTVLWTNQVQCLEYTVNWIVDSQSTDGQTITGSQTTRLNNVEIKDVQPNTDYTVTVAWEDGQGKKTEMCKGKMPPAGTIDRIDLTCQVSTGSKSQQQLTVLWTSPPDFMEYTVNWVLDSQSMDDQTIAGSQTTRLNNMEIKDAEPNTEYSVTVAWEDVQGKKNETCKGRMPPAGPIDGIDLTCQVNTDSKSHQQLTVLWKRPALCLAEYTVEWFTYPEASCNEETFKGQIKTRLNNVQIDEILPNTWYTVTVTWRLNGENKIEICEAFTPSV